MLKTLKTNLSWDFLFARVNQACRKRILFQVIYPALLIAIVVESLLIPTRGSWPWSYKDSIAGGLFLFAAILFVVFRRQAYAQRKPWLFIFFWFAAATSLVLFRRWGIMATGCIGLLLLLTLVMRSKFLTEGIPREAIVKILLLSGAGLFALALTEGLLRLFSDRLPVEIQRVIRADPSNYGVVHSYIGYLHRPNNTFVVSGKGFSGVHHTDGHGFRNPWPWPERVEIITLGDSVTFGQGVNDEQAWPAVLARAFPSSRIINLGLIGAGPQQYLRVYETFGLTLHPKVVLVGFFIGNDFWDAEMFDRWLKSGAGGSYMVWRDFGKPASVGSLVSRLLWRGQLLARKSYLYNLLLYVRENVQNWVPSGKKVFEAPDGRRVELSPASLANNTKRANPGDHVFQVVIDALQRIDSLAKENGATALVVLQRSKEEVYLPLLGESPPDAAAPLREALGERGIPYLDLLQEFRRRAAAGEVLFFEADGHPNSRGYALIAEIVSSYLKEHAREYGL